MVGLITFSSVTVARAADIATTLHFNPSLSREANPLSSVLGFDAAQLVVSNLILVVLFLLVPLIFYVVRGPAKIMEKAHTLTEYMSIQLFRSKLERNCFLCGVFLGWPLPKNWLQATRVFGFAVSWAVVFASLQATFAWWATNQWGMDWYGQYRALLNFHGYPVIELVPVVFVFYLVAYALFKREFYAWQLTQAEQGVAPNA